MVTLNGGCVASRRMRVCLIGVVSLLGACKENGTGPTAPCGLGSTCSGSAQLTSLTLTPAVDTLLVGDKAQIVFAATNASGAVTGITVAYKSSDTAVAKVDTAGLVSAVGVGATTITIAAGGLKASSHLTVLSASVMLASSGADYSCMVLTLGRGYCWGQDALGQLAAASATTCFDSASTTNLPCALSPIAMSGGIRWTAISAGGSVACGLNTASKAFCWGDNTFGEMGIGAAGGGGGTPTAVAGALTFTAIAAGAQHVCGVATGSRIFCWGNDAVGQLGDTGIVNSTTPIPVDSAGVVMSFASVTTGAAHTCALKAGGAAYCWGDNTFGQLGTGTAASHSTPVNVAGGLVFSALTAGATHTCGLTTGGAAFCWGDDTFGELGNGASGSTQASPVAVSGGHAFTELSAGDGFTCGLSGTTVYCWGSNADGQIGAGASVLGGMFTAPSAVVTSLTFAYVSAGKRHVCGIVAKGVATACWGSNIFGALGNALQAATSGTPVIVGTPLS